MLKRSARRSHRPKSASQSLQPAAVRITEGDLAARLGWDGPVVVRELRAEIAPPFLTSQLGLPVLADMKKLTNHHNHLTRWVQAMHADPSLIFNVTADASEAVEYLLSLGGS